MELLAVGEADAARVGRTGPLWSIVTNKKHTDSCENTWRFQGALCLFVPFKSHLVLVTTLGYEGDRACVFISCL